VIDDTSIKLMTSPTMPAAKTLTTGNVAGDTFTLSGHGFSNGQPVTYRAPAPKQFTINDVNDAADTITIAGHGFVHGDVVRYTTNRIDADGNGSLDGFLIGGLGENGTYYVVNVSGNTFQLATSLGDPGADPPVPPTIRTVAPNENDNSLHFLRKVVDEPFGNLTEGRTYYVVTPVDNDATKFKLATNANGTGIVTPNTAGRSASASHSLRTEGIDLNTGSGRQEVQIDITSAGSPNQVLLGGGGVSLRIIAPPPGDGVSSSTAKGGGGGVGDFGFPKARNDSSATVKANVAAALVQAGGNVEISTSSRGNVTSYASNTSGGLLKVDEADAEANYTNTNYAFIGQDGDINNISASGVTIVAGGRFILDADSGATADASSRADGGGGIAITEADSDTTITSNTYAVLGRNADVTARNVQILARVSNMDPKADAWARAIAFLNATATANADATVNSTVRALLEGNTSSNTILRGVQGVDVRTLHASVDPRATHKRIPIALIPVWLGSANTHATLNTKVDADPGVTVYAGPRPLLGVTTNTSADDTPLVKRSGFDRLALFVEADHSGSREGDNTLNVT